MSLREEPAPASRANGATFRGAPDPSSPASAVAAPGISLTRALGLRDLTLFYIVSGIGLRWIATAAAAGESSIVIWLLACCGFFLPLAAGVLELSSRYPQEGGIYVWTSEAYGEFAGFMAGWTYWMSNLPYFPAVLYFAASNLLFAGPAVQRLAVSRAYYLIFTFVVLALITGLNIAGVRFGKWLNNAGAVGTMLPILLLIGAAAISALRFGAATHFTLAGLAPHTGFKDLVFWSTIFFAFAGCETGSFMGDEIQDARRTIPRALLVAGIVITLAYVVGTAAMLTALPANLIVGLNGFMSAMELLLRKIGLGAFTAPAALLVAAGSIGGVAAFLSSTSRLPFVAGIDRYLPPAFARIHPRWKTPYVALTFYGLMGIVFGLLSQAGTSVAGAYDLLVSMGIVTAFIPYLFLFAAIFRLQSRPFPPGAIRFPGGAPVALVLAGLGLLSTVATIALSLFPSPDEAHPTLAFIKVTGMTGVLLLAGAAIYARGRRTRAMEKVRASE